MRYIYGARSKYWAALIAVLVMLLLSGCSTTSNAPIRMAGGEYVITEAGRTGFANPSNVKAEALRLAAELCAPDQLEVIELTEAKPPFLLGNYPRTDVRFRCVK